MIDFTRTRVDKGQHPIQRILRLMICGGSPQTTSTNEKEPTNQLPAFLESYLGNVEFGHLL